MQNLVEDLQKMAHYVSAYGIHDGEQMAATGPEGFCRLDISAVAFYVTEGHIPQVFFTDEVAAIRLIESSARAMACIRAISEVLDSAVCETQIEPGTWVPDYIEHVSNWVLTTPIAQTNPPTVSEVVGRILRAANHAATQTPAA